MQHPDVRRIVLSSVAAGVGCLLMGSFAPLAGGAEPGLPAPGIVPGPVVSWGGPAQMHQLLSPPVGLDDAVAIAASDTNGSYSNLALRANGAVVGWGLNAHGEATPPAGLSGVVAIDTGAGFSLALKSDGSVVAWGANDSGALDVPADLGPVTAISAGGYDVDRGLGAPRGVCGFALALRPNGTVVRWGQDKPDLGCTRIDARMDPPAGLDGVVAISAGAQQALALRADGTVVAWGTGVTSQNDGTPPAQWSDVVAVSAGSMNSLGLRSDGVVLAYGIWGESGPPRVSDVAAISASSEDAFLHRDGTISVYRGLVQPGPPAGQGFQAVSAGYDYGLAIAAGAPKPSPLLGSAIVQPSVDSNPSGTAESFQYTATQTGTATALHVYLDERNDASEVIVGVYEDTADHPGHLVASGRSSRLTPGEWNAIPIDGVRIVAGQRYWLALLSPLESGTIRFRDLPDGEGGPTKLSRQRALSSDVGLPDKWKTRRDFANSPASLYLT
jgi:hypothetical protein